MRNSSTATKKSCSAMLIAVLVALAGCESTDNWLKKWTDSDKEAIILGAPGTNEYLNEIYNLANGDPATQAEIFVNAEESARLTPGTSTRLRYALVLATPGHRENDDLEGQSLLRELLAEPDLMTPGETALATIHLREVEARLVLVAEAERLRAEAGRTNSSGSSTEAAALARRVANVEAENRRLQSALAEAEAKLEALSAIERSLRNQSGNGDPR